MTKSIIYLIIQIYFNIYFVIMIFFYYNQNFNFKHYAAIKRVIRYLKNIINHEIIYKTVDELKDYTNID